MNTNPGGAHPESQAPGPHYPPPPAPHYPAGLYSAPPTDPGIAPPYYTPPPSPQPTMPPAYPGYPPYGSAPAGAYPGYYAGPMPPSANGLAIASLVCAFIPVLGGVMGPVFGHVALSQINNSEGREQGRGMAIAGLIIGYANLALSLLFIALVVIAIIAAANANQPASFVM